MTIHHLKSTPVLDWKHVDGEYHTMYKGYRIRAVVDEVPTNPFDAGNNGMKRVRELSNLGMAVHDLGPRT